MVGSSASLEKVDNGNHLSVNSAQINQPGNIVQDTDTEHAPFIDLDMVKGQMDRLNTTLSAHADTPGVDKNLNDMNDSHITIAKPDGASYVNIDAANLRYKLRLDGFEEGHNGSLIINVDCSGWTEDLTVPENTVYISEKPQDTSETVNFSNGKVIWNFINTEGMTSNNKKINIGKTLGTIIAPDAAINLAANVNGHIIGKKVVVSAESHRTDFTGTTVPANAVFHVGKTVNGQTPAANEQFSFKMEKYANGSWESVADNIPNSGAYVNFPTQTYTQAGTYWYRLRENSDSKLGDAGYEFDTTTFLVKVEVTQEGSVCKATSSTYRADDLQDDNPVLNNTPVSEEVENPCFENTKETYRLPESGGMGTTPIMLAGLALIAAAGAAWINGKRRKLEDTSDR